MLSRGEPLLASTIATLAAAVLIAYAPFRAGLRVSPAGVLLLAVAAGAACALWLLRHAKPSRDLGAVIGIVAGAAATLLWLAGPQLLPIGGGPDLTHHLVLINYIERAWRLVDDPALSPYLGDMMDYTPGSHLLIALAGAWTGTDGIHAAHPVLALTVALKAGVLFCVARRVVPGTSRIPWAVAAVLLVFLPYQYVVGSFAVHSFWAQVVSELFAVGAWWAVVAWDEDPSPVWMALFGLFGAAAFVTWPIWIGPMLLTAAAVIALRERMTLGTKAVHFAIAAGPIALVAVVHAIGKLGRLQMAGTSGYVVRPTPALYSWGFLALAIAGLFWLATDRRGRATLSFLIAILAQSAALYAVARSQNAETPYMALKTLYLTPYPLAIAGAFALASGDARRGPPSQRIAWAAVIVLAAAAVFRFGTAPRPAPVVTGSALAAGRWARDHVDRACVDYLVTEGYTGYWLHLAVLDNPRDTPRLYDPDTFEPSKAIGRWVDSDGLPYAIVDDVDRFSKALFSGTDAIAAFGPARVIKRRGASTCGTAR